MSIYFVDDGLEAKLRKLLKPLWGKTVSITIKEKRKIRSKKQNDYYWGVVVPAIREWFFDAGEPLDDEEVHDLLKSEVGKLRRAVLGPEGEYHFVTKSTTKLTTIEFENYLTIIRVWASQRGCFIPMPREVYE